LLVVCRLRAVAFPFDAFEVDALREPPFEVDPFRFEVDPLRVLLLGVDALRELLLEPLFVRLELLDERELRVFVWAICEPSLIDSGSPDRPRGFDFRLPPESPLQRRVRDFIRSSETSGGDWTSCDGSIDGTGTACRRS
jgi:hypothetical protein